MKKLFFVLILTLALNFLALGGAVGYLFQSGKLDKAKITKIKEVIFPPPGSTSTTQPSTPTTPATPQPFCQPRQSPIDKHSGSVIEQVDFIRRTVDAQMLELDQRQRQMADLQRQVDLANQKLATDRVALDKARKER